MASASHMSQRLSSQNSRQGRRRWGALRKSMVKATLNAMLLSRATPGLRGQRRRRVVQPMGQGHVFGAWVSGNQWPGFGSPEEQLNVVLQGVAVPTVEVQAFTGRLE